MSAATGDPSYEYIDSTLMRRHFAILGLLSFGPLHAQSLNVDVGANALFPLPSASYAAAGRAGVWNAASAHQASGSLVALDGASTSVTLSSSGGFLNFDYDNAGTSGDDQALLDDAHDVGGSSSSATWTFQGLQSGDYTVTTYAWAPDNAAFRTRVSIAGALEPDQIVGGAWSGAHALGVTFARHHVNIGGSTLAIVVSAGTGFASLNGIQLERGSTFTPFCFGDGSGTACPCGNASAVGAGEGCLSSLGIGGKIVASGAASVSADTMQLVGSQMPSSFALYFQGTSQAGGGAGSVFGDGLRCAGGSTVRLGTKLNAAGASSYPEVGDPSISIKGGCLAGDARTYQCWYRNGASFCAPETFNLTSGMSTTWVP